MKIQTVITGLILGFLLGCGESKQDAPISQPTPTPPVQPTNIFDSVSFPQDACGDNLPEDPQAYPVDFYPVYIDYSESNLQAVKSKFCRDALKKYREAKGKDYIQVASFVGEERANQFKKLMQQELGSGEIGEATVIEAPLSNREVFPKEYCGDNPQDIKSYPTYIYPVFTWAEDIDNIKLQLCQNAQIGQAPSEYRNPYGRNREAVVLGYFFSQKAALLLKDEIGNRLDNIQIGNPYKITSNPSELGRLAKLTDSQTQDLLSFAKNNRYQKTFKIILPAYIPDGYKVAKFNVYEGLGGPVYHIEYQNSNNSCFSIHGSSGGWGGAPEDYERVEVLSSALGKVVLGKTDFDRYYNMAQINLVIEAGLLINPQRYSFSTSWKANSCTPVQVQEAVKIVESFQYLNP
ncbi:hypothetical protein JJD41_13210 [Oxynema sp. CENA135]|uniref:hypothetical protein n=1 Tax=Oxynema sp. CENA135 TaxID=984206 RepID=UPI00190B3385|nr:hypothetical protein [Oxynema sp. CENA135]MBK4730815.1 hypothetical protein [Oxynema sp. CENA135]